MTRRWRGKRVETWFVIGFFVTTILLIDISVLQGITPFIQGVEDIIAVSAIFGLAFWTIKKTGQL